MALVPHDVMEVTGTAEIEDGPHRMPKGLRRANGLNAVLKSVPVNRLRMFKGYAKLESTAVYLDAASAQQQEIAARIREWFRSSGKEETCPTILPPVGSAKSSLRRPS